MNIIDRASDNIRILAASMVEKSKSGHPGGAMGGADFVNVLYSQFLNFDPDDLQWPFRDRFILDPGHMAPMLYSVLSMIGAYTMEELQTLRQWGSVCPGHPEIDQARGVENTSGPLGQGCAMAVGAAIAERFLVARFGEWMAHKTYSYISDGAVEEEISQAAGRIAGTLGLSNLIMFYDSNNIQLSTKVDHVMKEDTAKKYEAWGWDVITVNGNNAEELAAAIKKAQAATEKPTLIIGNTLMAKGALTAACEDFSNTVSTHGQPLSAAGACINETIKGLGGDPENPFVIFDEVKEYYANCLDAKRKYVAAKKAEYAAWQEANPELAAQLKAYLAGDMAAVDFKAIAHKPGVATRQASADVLVELAKAYDNFIVSSADLSNSDKTDGYIKGGARDLVKGDFSGKFFQAGVAELTMACICNGIALHGGARTACATFMFCSDYMKPALRLSALMELPVIYIWSHDSFRVGEDGPTHEPVEHEAQLRLMEQLKNHHGENSVLVLRPADAAETSVCWKMAIENTKTPTALILSRQNIKDLPAAADRYDEALQAEKGGYIVTKTGAEPKVVLLASGSEVATLVEAAELLKERDGIAAQIVSVPSEGLFRNQAKEYQEEVIPAALPKFGLTAGLPVTLAGLVGANGTVYGLDHFGYSAPAKVLDEKFGFTGENIYNEIKKLF